MASPAAARSTAAGAQRTRSKGKSTKESESSSESEHDDKKKPMEKGFEKGAVVEATRFSYTIMRKLGEGGFGAVYKVKKTDGSTDAYAMKTEKERPLKPGQTKKHHDRAKLLMEVKLLEIIEQERITQKTPLPHFVQLFDKAKRDNFRLMVISLLGKSLGDLKGAQPKPHIFTLATAVAAGRQCLEALRDLHKLHYIHRDVKPGNFAVGYHDARRIVFLLDFGIARRIYDPKKGRLIRPRIKAKFMGTLRFASIRVHRNLDQSFRDDLESWFYALVDMSLPDPMCWKRACDEARRMPQKEGRALVLREKELTREGDARKRLCGTETYTQFSAILEYIDSLVYKDEPNYDLLFAQLTDLVQKKNLDLDAPFDWESARPQRSANSIE